MTGAERDGDWSSEAGCRDEDPDLFFPAGESEAGQRRLETARTLCAGCTVRKQCLDFAITTKAEYGMWGGSTPRERRRLQRSFGLTHRRTTRAAILAGR